MKMEEKNPICGKYIRCSNCASYIFLCNPDIVPKGMQSKKIKEIIEKVTK